jgi:hypothetical protein
MGENGRRFVATNYSRNSLAALYVEVINQVIKEFSGRLR